VMYAAMKKMAASNVLIAGLHGLGAEIGKPLC
jgi:ubiquitin-activating enzyme E1